MSTQNSSYAELNTILEQARSSPHSLFRLTEQQLVGLQHRWCTALSARLDSVIEFAGSRPLPDAVAVGWRELATERNTLRSLLDAGERTSQKLVDGLRAEARMLAHATGLVGLDDPIEEAVRVGLSYRERIRSCQEWSTPAHTEIA